MGEMFVVWLDEIDCQNIQLSGGKAANLSRLAARYPIPPGFCVTTAAYASWSPVAHGNGGNDRGIVPLQAAVATAYAALAQRMEMAAPRVAVRSSAVGEDSHDASFAGQYDTYLNLVGDDAVVTSILRCWHSAQSARVMAYQSEQRSVTTGTTLAVLVQALVPADVSFVAFSGNPVTGDQSEVVINASWGLGESVVSGTVTPDMFTVQKMTGTLRNSTITDKARMTIAADDGVREVKTPRTMRKKPALTAAQACEIAHLAATLETEMGWPVDIEGAYQGDTLYLLQCRPISTLI